MTQFYVDLHHILFNLLSNGGGDSRLMPPSLGMRQLVVGSCPGLLAGSLLVCL